MPHTGKGSARHGEGGWGRGHGAGTGEAGTAKGKLCQTLPSPPKSRGWFWGGLGVTVSLLPKPTCSPWPTRCSPVTDPGQHGLTRA